MSSARRMLGSPAALALAVALLCLGLLATAIDGVFTVDENHHLAAVVGLRHGRLTVPFTEGYPKSAALRFFDPEQSNGRRADSPAAPSLPPLHGFLALPFSYAGWRGLVGLNVLALGIACALLAHLARRHMPGTRAAWLGVTAFAAGGYVTEYAQGVWPHMVSTALVLGAFALVSRAREEASVALAAVAGLVAGLACELRYQNVVPAAALGLALVALAPRRRWALLLAFGAGFVPPLAAGSFINHARLGIWNPLSKGGAYATVQIPAAAAGAPLWTRLHTLWAKLVDFRAMVPVGNEALYLQRHEPSGALLVGLTSKKALLQSCPWVAAALVAMLANLRAPRRDARARDVTTATLILGGTFALFAALGPLRTDGFVYNQRYFIDLLPLAALVLALSDGDWFRPGWAFVAALGTLTAYAFVPSFMEGATVRLLVISLVPLALSALGAAAWMLRRRGRAAGLFASVTLGLGIAWGAAVHFDDDLRASRRRRLLNEGRLAQAEPVLPERAAVFAAGVYADAYGPLLLDHTVVIASPLGTQPADLVRLRDAFFARGWRVFIHSYFPEDAYDALTAGRALRPTDAPGLAEILPARADGRE